jgi:hypothetical protein
MLHKWYLTDSKAFCSYFDISEITVNLKINDILKCLRGAMGGSWKLFQEFLNQLTLLIFSVSYKNKSVI